MDKILILTPVKNAAIHLATYFRGLESLTYPQHLLSLGVLESDSTDGTWERMAPHLEALRPRFQAVHRFRRDFGFTIPPGLPRWAPRLQVQRRSILARARNQLLFRALDDEEWVLWLDVDVIEYPPDIIERLLSTGKQIVTPNCVYQYGGTSFDLNSWRDRGRLHLHDLKPEGDLVPLDAVGGTMLLVHADIHRDGLIFPSFPYGLGNPKVRREENYWAGEIETEGLGMMASDAGVQCWGMPHLEIRHYCS
jgi:glycosyltransferase involved in cell wall biosynthesis